MPADFIEVWEWSGTKGFDYLLTRCIKSMRSAGRSKDRQGAAPSPLWGVRGR